MDHGRDELGSSMLVSALFIGVIALLGSGIMRISAEAHRDARAQSIADLAALAVAGGDPSGARDLVARSGARVVRVGVSDDGRATVTVSIDGTDATASAAQSWPPVDPASERGSSDVSH